MHNLIRDKKIYFGHGYDSKERFCSYWHQINEIVTLSKGNILYIGVGNGFVPNYLRERGLPVITMDINIQLHPTVLSSVSEISFQNKTFDTVVCCEVLEHIPYERLVGNLKEIGRVAKNFVILSLPDVTTAYRIDLELPRMSGRFQQLINHPFHRPIQHKYDGEHHWEIGKKLYPLKRVIADIRKAGLEVKVTYRVFENYRHRFLIIKM